MVIHVRRHPLRRVALAAIVILQMTSVLSGVARAAEESSIVTTQYPPPVSPAPGATPGAPAAAPAPAAVPSAPLETGRILPQSQADDEHTTPGQEVERLRTRGERQRVAGILLLLAGAGLAAGGGVVLAKCCQVPDVSTITSVSQIMPLVNDARGQLILGGVLAGVGLSGLVTGITLTAVGQSNINAARRLGDLSLAPAPSGSFGASLRLGF
jgi:hypothetical protein